MFPSSQPLSDLDYTCKALSALRGVSLAHYNIRSLYNKFDSIKSLLNNTKLKCLGITETFLSDKITDPEISVPGYRLHRSDRNSNESKNNGGGIVVYTSNNYQFIPILGSNVCNYDIETLWLDLKLVRARPTVLCFFYRPPSGNLQTALSILQNQYDQYVARPDSDVIMLGDMNADWLKGGSDKNKLNHFLKLLSLDQIITNATRICERSCTLLDHIYVNNTNLYVHSGTVEPGLSDHALVFVTRKKTKPNRTKKSVFIRDMRSFDPTLFANDVRLTDWSEVYNGQNVNESTDLFNCKFVELINQHMPFKRKIVYCERAPWVNNELLSLIDRREHMAREHRIRPNAQTKCARDEAAKSVVKLNIALKRSYIARELERHKNDPKKLWRAIRAIWPNSKNKNTPIHCINGETDPAVISNMLNQHFCEAGERVQSTTRQADVNIHDFYQTARPPVFDLKPIRAADLMKAINRMSTSHSSGMDGITSSMVKCCKNEILPVLEYLFNKSLSEHTFPTTWKCAKITAIHKKDDTTDPNNYRPISLLPSIAKVFERVVHTQCYNYMEENSLFNERQSGFRRGRSTGTCLQDFLHFLYTQIDSGRTCGVLFLDLTKAFDTVDHEILCRKLKLLGFKSQSVAWFRSYLENRIQYTQVNNHLSSVGKISCGVPQGSILGPLLFCIYVNDLGSCLKTGHSFMYADDTALTFSGHSTCELTHDMNTELLNINDWFLANRLMINAKKTNSMIIYNPRAQHSRPEVNLELHGTQIEQVSDFKYLGVWLDDKLTFKTHIAKLKAKVGQRNGLLWRLRNCIDTRLAKYLYTSLIDPLFLYCNYIYDACGVELGRELQISQNTSLRAILKVNNRYPTDQLHSETGIEWLGVTRAKSCCIEMFKLLHGIGPSSLTSEVKLYKPTRTLRSENEYNLVKLRCKTKFAENDGLVRGGKLWDLLDIDTKSAKTVDTFKTKIKKSDNFYLPAFTTYRNVFYT